VNGDTVKTSAGAVIFPFVKLNILKMRSSFASVELKLLLRPKRQTIYDISLNEPVAIIMGSEDRGVNPSVLKIVDEKLNFLCLEVSVP
jgi:23S rRNA (guanosine2251-2'-O)-methyltransferase